MITRRFFLLFIVTAGLIVSCGNDKPTEPSATKPKGELDIKYPTEKATVSGIVPIQAEFRGYIIPEEIKFYIDEKLKHVVVDTPYIYQWDTHGFDDNTFHVLQAKAYAEDQILAESGIITVKVNNTPSGSKDEEPPSVTLTSPSPGDTLSGEVNIYLEALDNTGIKKTAIYIDNVLKSSESHYIWNTLDYSDGVHTLLAKAWDFEENEGQSQSIQVTVDNSDYRDNTPPSVQIVYPPPGEKLAGAVKIRVSALDVSGIKNVQIYIDNKLAASADTCLWSTLTYPDGDHLIYAKAWDNNANEATSPVITVTTSNSCTLNKNLIANPGFEEDKDGWKEQEDFILESTDPHGGEYCALVKDHEIINLILLHGEPEQIFTISFWYRSWQAETRNYFSRLELESLDDKINIYFNREAYVPTGWTQYETAFSPNKACKIRLVLGQDGSGICFDDFVIKRIQ
ncbi:hypothetical protein JW935_18715 [candidate division KSB1 bacterium]|nr:hypothetical protein [candidate division KSB1 bacterium]